MQTRYSQLILNKECKTKQKFKAFEKNIEFVPEESVPSKFALMRKHQIRVFGAAYNWPIALNS
jgi:hypothetical protein